MNSPWLGLDIGGANLKAWFGGKAISRPFELWKNPHQLVSELSDLAGEFTGYFGVSVTMTGELCDCFDSRHEGVAHIAQAVQGCCADSQIVFYQTDGEFVGPEIAIASWRKTAAANWHAIASAAMQFLPEQAGILIDIGSTTTDLVPFLKGQVTARGLTDLERLQQGELLYTGVQRSPVCAVTNHVELAGRKVSLAQEWFASMQDVYVALEMVTDVNGIDDGLDGRPADYRHSLARLARVVCSDVEELGVDAIIDMARQIAEAHQAAIRSAIQCVLESNPKSAGRILVAGQGEWLAQRIAGQLVPELSISRLSDFLDSETSRCAAAWAVSWLAEKRCGAIA